MPITSTAGEPIMKSMWICERLIAPKSCSETVNSYAEPSATWEAAFSSISVS